MHTQVNRSRFEIKDTMVVHIPTGTEFIAQVGNSFIVWTGDIGQRLSSGEVYRYGDVLDMMRDVWPESAMDRHRLTGVRQTRTGGTM